MKAERIIEEINKLRTKGKDEEVEKIIRHTNKIHQTNMNDKMKSLKLMSKHMEGYRD